MLLPPERDSKEVHGWKIAKNIAVKRINMARELGAATSQKGTGLS